MESLSECRQLSEKELERDWAAAGPCVLVVFRFGESKVKQLRSGTISFPDEPVSHAACGLVVVGWPAAIEIDPEFSLRLDEDALEQIVPVSKRARKARDLAEDVRPLPSEVKRNNASE